MTRKRKGPEGCDPNTGNDRSFHVNEFGYEEEEGDQEDWFAPFRAYSPPVVPNEAKQGEEGPPAHDEKRGDGLDRLLDEVAGEPGDWNASEPPKGQIIPYPERQKQAPIITNLASLSPGQVSALLGITEFQAVELLQVEAIALAFDDLREVDPTTGISMTYTTAQVFHGFKGSEEG